MNTCNHCATLFLQTAGTYGKFCSLSCSSQYAGAIRKHRNIEKYLKDPKVCKNCNTIIPYSLRKSNLFCNKSCAAKFNNSKKDWSKIKTGPPPKPKIPKSKISRVGTPFKKGSSLFNADGPYTKIYLCTCKHTGKKWYSPTVKTIHPSATLTKKLYSYQSRFTFSIRSYPEWFSYASDLINTNGWYSAANRGNNLSGCSRDHLYSVSDGYKNNVDPKIISHPANCQIIPHRKNQSKNKKSVITLIELEERIKKFNQMYMEMPDGIEPSYKVLQTSA